MSSPLPTPRKLHMFATAALLAVTLSLPVSAQHQPKPADGPAQSEPQESKYLKNIKQLTFDGLKAGEGYFSKDGKRIVFQSVREGCPHYQIYTMNVDGSDQKMISTGKGKTTCAYFNPMNGKELIYASTHLDKSTWPPVIKTGRGYSWDFDKSMDIFIADSNTGKISKQLTSAKGYDAEGSYSPDGKMIVFTSTRDDPSGDIYIINTDGTGLKRLTKTKGYDGGPFFSPDGKRVVFRGFRDPSGRIAQVFTIDLDGKNEKQLTYLPRINWCPIYHPNGKYIIYAANHNGHNFELFLVKTDGSGEVQLTFNSTFDGLPCFSPDGKKLLWTSARDKTRRSQLFIADFVMPADKEFKPQPKNVKAQETTKGYDYHGGKKNPHSSDASKNPHGNNPHGNNPHGSNPHGSNPHGASPHGSNPHSRPASQPTTQPAHGAPGSKAAKSNPHGSSFGKEAAKLPIVRGSRSGDNALKVEPKLAQISQKVLTEDVVYLSSEALEGREVGTRGARRAAKYLVERFKDAGAQAGSLDGEWLYPFEFISGTKIAKEGQSVVVTIGGKASNLENGKQYRPLLYSASKATGPLKIMFCGYGIQSKKHKYNDFADLKLNGEAALILTRGPRSKNGGSFNSDRPRQIEDLRFKIANARDAGAGAVVFVRSKGEGWLKLPSGDPGIPVVQIQKAVATELFGKAGVNFEKLIADIDGDLKPRSFAVDNASVAVSVKLKVERRTGHNVLAKVYGSDPKLRHEIVVIGGHYDHLGYGAHGSRTGTHEIHNGADDNASGTAALLALAKYFKANRPKRTILFMAFDGEERGLLGSAAWAKKPTTELDNVVAMLNMDMIGRLATNKVLLVGGINTCKGTFQKLISNLAHTTGLDIALDPGGQGASDHTNFYNAKIPVLSFFTQTHDDYHTPRDDWDTLDYKGMTQIVRLVALTATKLANGQRYKFNQVKVNARKGRSRVATGEALPYFGSIPDYAQSKETKGVLISGARPGSPADKAGLKSGDVIVEFAGRSVRNIYDYTYAIQGCTAGQKIKVVVRRAGKKVTLDAKLGSR